MAALLRRPHPPIVKRHLQILLLYAKGMPVKTISRRVKLSIPGIYVALKSFQKSGLPEIFKFPRRGGRRGVFLTKEHIREVASWVGDPRSLDFYYSASDCRKFAKRILKKWGIKTTWQTVYIRLRKFEGLANS